MLNTVFLGSSDFALPILNVLCGHASLKVAAVVTQPDRQAGRGRKPTPTPVGQRAAERGMTVWKPGDLAEIREELAGVGPDLMVCAAFGAWLPRWLLKAAPLGVVNVHPSLLPAYRGAAPVPRTLLDGCTETGVSFMLTDAGWDTGPVIHRLTTPVLPGETAGELTERLARIGAEALPEVLLRYARGELVPCPQTGEASYAGKITREDARLNWDLPAEVLARQVRAFNPVPGAWTIFRGRELKVFRAEPRSGRGHPGTFRIQGQFLEAATGQGMLAFLEVQPQSGRRMEIGAFLRGLRGKGETP